MTVKHWNTGAAAARYRIQAASVKLKKNKNKSKASSIKPQAKKWKLNKFTMDEEVYIEVKE